ncbi:MAG: 2,3-bisphosphoglycerate-independent phosphoglycerate mutase [Bacteroidales bacterium]|nr:2,3-bisphosphoglycerate-independent phosphoglycerate mutase [Bacteroidales bacterium]MBP5518513.1 2,3-bisphosphoglycerate-independent phosphoglycerate mutase [Bacteroidales bacterium]
MGKKVLLMILDGWGLGREDKSNAIYTQGQPNIDALRAKYPHSQLMACGEDVGLPDGQMGNSEVGHLNIGAGRVVYQDLVKINKVCREHKMLENKEIKAVMDYAKEGHALHFLGLVSRGGVHSSLEHLFGFLDTAKECGLEKVYVHCFMDGRDTDPRSGKGFVAELEEHMKQSCGKVASVCGRFYAMDRDKRWNRIKEAYDLLTEGKGAAFTSAQEGIQASYDAEVTDEFIKPICIVENGKPVATIKENDAVIFFNFRNDRAREMTSVLTQKDMPEEGMHTIPLYYCCLTPYDDQFKGLHILFDKENVQKTLGEVVAAAGKNQLRIAETEKYAHVTFFFNGGREEPFENEDRILVASPKVATYDLQPEMSAPEVAGKLIEAIRTGKEDMIILNFANGDMVGHTGVYPAICKAVETIDKLVGKVVKEARKMGYTVLITADHGNADYAVNEDGTPNTAHSLNPVQFVVVDPDVKSVENGRLCDIAPTILHLMEIPQPAEMTGKVLVKE